MIEKLTEIVEYQEGELYRHQKEQDEITAKIRLMSEHSFPHELNYWIDKKNTMQELFYAYKKSTETLRDVLDAWNS